MSDSPRSKVIVLDESPVSRIPTRPAVGGALVLMAVLAIGLGAWWGFPRQDDTYMIRLLRLGGPELVLAKHPDRPVFGFLLETSTRIAGEHRLFYVAVAVLGWMALAAETALLWARLFPVWSAAWPAVVLAVLAPVVTHVPFTTVTTVWPCVLPVVLVLAATRIVSSRPDSEVGLGRLVAAALLAASAAAVSEYALPTLLAAATLLLIGRRWRGLSALGAGSAVGYLLFRSISDIRLRVTTDPDVQLETILRQPWSPPLRILTAAWECVAGAWGRAASQLRLDWSSKSTLLAGAVSLAAAVAAGFGTSRLRREPSGAVDRTIGSFLAVIAAVIAALIPTFAVIRSSMSVVYNTRFFVPVLPFAACATLGGLLCLVRPRFAPLVLSALTLVSMNSLVVGAMEERRLAARLERIGEGLRPLIANREGLVVVVSAVADDAMPEEVIGKMTQSWRFPDAGRLWIMRPDGARVRFGPRSGCRSLDSLRVEPLGIRATRAEEPIRLILWDASRSDTLDLEPYFRDCPPVR